MSDEQEHRVLGPEMTAEKWVVIGGDDLLWMHPPSRRTVNVEAIRWGSCTNIPSFEATAPAPDDEGYLVTCAHRDEQGNPTCGDCFWTASYVVAVREARKLRQAILDEKPALARSAQLTLDDALRTRQ